MKSLDGRIALITGAGQGIGRAEALFFASEGAKVVVNDRGVARDGSGMDVSLAKAVVNEITVAGGEAVANTDDVTNWDGARRMVEAGIEAFGDLHVVVNNAGIERHAALESMTEDEFDSVIAVNLKGTFLVSRWAARYWREQFDAGVRVDRAIINTSSGSGLTQCLPLQTNYAASKAGVGAMTLVAALELSMHQVRVNCVSPSMIRTRTSIDVVPGFSNVPPPGTFDPRHPDRIAPVAAYLATARCPLNGQVLSVRGAAVTLLRGWSAGEHVEKRDEAWTVAELAPVIEALPRDDVMATLMATLEEGLGPQGMAELEKYGRSVLENKPSD